MKQKKNTQRDYNKTETKQKKTLQIKCGDEPGLKSPVPTP